MEKKMSRNRRKELAETGKNGLNVLWSSTALCEMYLFRERQRRTHTFGARCLECACAARRSSQSSGGARSVNITVLCVCLDFRGFSMQNIETARDLK